MEAVLKQEIFRRITCQRQFRREYDIGTPGSGLAGELGDAFPVAGKIPDGTVDLGNGDFRRHDIVSKKR
jgi:hypothetical protein